MTEQELRAEFREVYAVTEAIEASIAIAKRYAASELEELYNYLMHDAEVCESTKSDEEPDFSNGIRHAAYAVLALSENRLWREPVDQAIDRLRGGGEHE